MSEQGLKLAQEKMVAAGGNPQAIDVFSHYYRQGGEGVTGFIAEDSIEPLEHPDLLSDVTVSEEDARAALGATVMIKLNGGLGTSMGMDRAKSLLPVRGGDSFLDLISNQVRSARQTYGAKLPLLFMNSFRTQADPLRALSGYPDLEADGLGLDFLQSQEPRLRADDLTPVEGPAAPPPEGRPPDRRPVEGPAAPAREWSPPGHGDLYPALQSSGILDRLLSLGYRYASVSN